MRFLRAGLAALALAGHAAVQAIKIDVNDRESLKQAASTVAFDMMSYYHANESGQIPGKLPNTWWTGGAMFMTLIQYWHWTGDESYNNVTIQGMIWQKGEYNDYMPSNWSNYLGNDDQVFWGLAAMTAAELNFPEDPEGPSWLTLAQGVFNNQVPRWDMTICEGGLRWQLHVYQAGWDIKNAISNGGLFQLAARLAYYTRNDTYAKWAEKIWDWSTKYPLIEIDKKPWKVNDLVTVKSACKEASHINWSYNYGTYISGAAYLYNYTKGSDKWKQRLDKLLEPTYQIFFPKEYGGMTMSEVACEKPETCDGNSKLFKGFLSSWLTFGSLVAPYMYDDVLPRIQASAVAAADTCTGGEDGEHCGIVWGTHKWDGTESLENQMSVLSVISSALVQFPMERGRKKEPLTIETGGTSKSDPNAGTGDDHNIDPGLKWEITTADRAGAGIVTAVFLCGWIGMVAWMIVERS